MSEALAHNLGVDAGLQGERGVRVPQVVEADARQPEPVDAPGEPPGSVGGVDRAAVVAADDEVAVDPGCAERELDLALLKPVTA